MQQSLILLEPSCTTCVTLHSPKEEMPECDVCADYSAWRAADICTKASGCANWRIEGKCKIDTAEGVPMSHACFVSNHHAEAGEE